MSLVLSHVCARAPLCSGLLCARGSSVLGAPSGFCARGPALCAPVHRGPATRPLRQRQSKAHKGFALPHAMPFVAASANFCKAGRSWPRLPGAPRANQSSVRRVRASALRKNVFSRKYMAEARTRRAVRGCERRVQRASAIAGSQEAEAELGAENGVTSKAPARKHTYLCSGSPQQNLPRRHPSENIHLYIPGPSWPKMPKAKISP